MAFKIERITRNHQPRPEGHYARLENNIEWQIQEVTMSASGRICLKLYDPTRKDQQLVQVCDIADLVILIDGATYLEY